MDGVSRELVMKLPGRPHSLAADNGVVGGFGEAVVLRHKEVHHFFLVPFREQPIFSTRAHVFQIDPSTKRNWMPSSKHAVTVSYFYDSTRNVYRIISLDGTKVRYCLFFCTPAMLPLLCGETNQTYLMRWLTSGWTAPVHPCLGLHEWNMSEAIVSVNAMEQLWDKSKYV